VRVAAALAVTGSLSGLLPRFQGTFGITCFDGKTTQCLIVDRTAPERCDLARSVSQA
jgi:hypothetical protein